MNSNNETRPAPVKAFCANCAQFGTTCHGAGTETPWTNCAMKKPTEEPRAIMDHDYTALIIKGEEGAEMHETAAAIMTPEEIHDAITEYRRYKRIREDAEKELEALQARIVAHMDAISTDTVTGTDFTATYKVQNRTKLDTKALDAAFPGLRMRYTVPNPCKAFKVN